jgi:hypothetical protein
MLFNKHSFEVESLALTCQKLFISPNSLTSINYLSTVQNNVGIHKHFVGAEIHGFDFQTGSLA